MNSQTATITDIGYSPVNSALGEVFEYDRNSNILSLERVYAGEPVQDAAMSYVGNRLLTSSLKNRVFYKRLNDNIL